VCVCVCAVRVGVCGVCVCVGALKYKCIKINWVGSFCECAVC